MINVSSQSLLPESPRKENNQHEVSELQLKIQQESSQDLLDGFANRSMTQLLAPKRMTEAFEEMATKKLKSLRAPKRESLLNENTPNIRGG